MEQHLTPFEALKQAIEVAGGQSAMSRLCGVTQPAVWKWLQSAKRMPPAYVLAAEAATGVSRHLLRPDIYPPFEAVTDAVPSEDCGPILSGVRPPVPFNRNAILNRGAA